MNISVVLCTWNNADRLNITLEAFTVIKKPDGVDWELVVVNNNSSDYTGDIVARYADTLPIKYIIEPKQGLSYARNSGLHASNGELIIFTDDDVKPSKDWLNIYCNAYRKFCDKFYFGGPIESEFEVAPDDMALIALAPCSVKGLNWGDEEKVAGKGEYFVSANWACSRNNLNKVGNFNVNLGLNPSTGKVLVGEETDLMNRLQGNGIKPYYLPDASLQHFVPQTKMTLRHIGDRTEATGKAKVGSDKDITVKWLLGVPRWMWPRLFVLYGRFLLEKIKMKKAYKEYLEYRYLKGQILAFLKQNNL